MAVRNDFSNEAWLISSALCLGHYFYMWQSETIAPINKLSYPAAFALAIGGHKLSVVANNMIRRADNLGPLEGYRETLLKTVSMCQSLIIWGSTMLPIMTYLESCHFLSNIPTKTDVTVSFIASLAMVNVHSYYDYDPVPE